MTFLALSAFALALAAVLVLAKVAPSWGLVDLPGGRKDHAHATPLVGGIAIYAAVIGAAGFIGFGLAMREVLITAGAVLAVGLWDDRRDISPRIKLLVQVMAGVALVWGAQVELRTVGNLVGSGPIGLWVFAIPLTIFAVVGVVNAVNMMDGIDGLAGSVSLVAFAWFALVALQSGLVAQAQVAIAFAGALLGFLVFNLRFPWQLRARVFLGDAGSLTLGFMLAWLAVDLTQGVGRSFPPINALWVLLLPIADCVSLVLRRVLEGKSPFVADRRHIHHYLLARGMPVSGALGVLMIISAGFGAVGYFGWRFAVPEPLLFGIFFVGFFSYHFTMTAAWKGLERTELEAEKAPA